MSLGTWRRAAPLLALVGLSACVSDALPRDDEEETDAAADARDVRTGDARVDATDARAEVGPPFDVATDASESGPADAVTDVLTTDALADAIDARADVTDAGADTIVTDTLSDGAADAGRDVVDARPPSDAVDTATPPDAADGRAPQDANDASIDVSSDGTSSDGSTEGGSVDGASSDAGDAYEAGPRDAELDGGDARSDANGGNDAGGIVFFEENFDTGLGVFATVAGCGTNNPVWSNVSGYAHASEPSSIGVSRITGPIVTVPANLSNITLRMSHRIFTEQGWDYGQLMIAKNGGMAAPVTTFVENGYVFGGGVNADTCQQADQAGLYPGWSGNYLEMVSVVDLSAAPFDVVAGDTVTITFRMATDSITVSGGTGWDINWVTLSGSP